MADADTAEKLVRNLAQRLEAILTANRRGLPAELRRSLACTNILETMNGTIRRVCRNVKHWQEAAKGAQSLPPPPAGRFGRFQQRPGHPPISTATRCRDRVRGTHAEAGQER